MGTKKRPTSPLLAAKAPFINRAISFAGLCLMVAGILTAGGADAEGARPARELPVGEIVPDITSALDAEQKYAYYLPKAYDPERTWPLLFVLDPRGRAPRALELFRAGAEAQGWIVMSAYGTRSDSDGDPNTPAFRALVDDAQRRFAIDSRRLYLAGMSGTAKVSWPFARMLEGNVAGVISTGGALAPEIPLGDSVPFAFFGIAGTLDFNYREMLELDRDLAGLGATHRFETFEGPHGWGPAESCADGIEWMELQAMKRQLAPVKDDLIDRRLAADLAAATAAAEAGDDLLAWDRFDQIVRDYDGLRDITAAASARDRIDKGALKRARAEEKKLMRAERVFRDQIQRWLHRLAQAGGAISRKQSSIDLGIASLKKEAGAGETAAERSAQRRLETLFVQTAFYLPQAFRARDQMDRVQLTLELATEIKPESPRPFWQLAGIHSKRGDLDKAFAALDSATTLGPVDVERLIADEQWTPLRDDPRWSALLSRLGAGTS